MASVATALFDLLRTPESLKSVRSPVLLPPSPPPGLADPAEAAAAAAAQSASLPLFPLPRNKDEVPPLTEHTLRASHLSWLIRARDLGERAVALIHARAIGLQSCWAGKATEAHIRSVQRAADEAKWVEERLRLAVRWCRQQGVGKIPMRTLVARRKGPAPLRPVHHSFPPSLLDLPYPLPIAQESNLYTLVVPRPPPISADSRRPQERDHEREAQRGEAPPMYTEEADEAAGERSLDRAEIEAQGGEVEYARALAELLRPVTRETESE